MLRADLLHRCRVESGKNTGLYLKAPHLNTVEQLLAFNSKLFRQLVDTRGQRQLLLDGHRFKRFRSKRHDRYCDYIRPIVPSPFYRVHRASLPTGLIPGGSGRHGVAHASAERRQVAQGGPHCCCISKSPLSESSSEKVSGVSRAEPIEPSTASVTIRAVSS